MNYYKRHLGDYAKDTRHLSLVEHGAFSLLLDYFYATEKPIPDDRCERIANAYADFERAAVRTVLEQFFVQTPEGWVNKRAVAEMEASHAKSLKAKGSAEKRWGETKCDRNANASETQAERNASHKPLATSHKPLEKQEQSAAPAKPKKTKSAELTLAQWTEALNGADAIPAGDPVFAWAAKVGLPDGWVALAWWAFEGRYLDADKTYTDWRAVFRKALAGDWLKLWRKDARTGEWMLTTAGEQARLESQP